MTLYEEYVAKMKDIQHISDTEQAHQKADELIAEFLEEIGCKELSDEYDAVEKWYA